MMNIDRTLAFTAVIEMRPGLPADEAEVLTTGLAEAMHAANPADRWAFAKSWLDAADPLSDWIATIPGEPSDLYPDGDEDDDS